MQYFSVSKSQFQMTFLFCFLFSGSLSIISDFLLQAEIYFRNVISISTQTSLT